MRVQYIRIADWRHFENIEIHPPEDSSLVCLTGGNGTGKSQILELLAASAQMIGLSSGSESNRPNPYNEVAALEVQFLISANSVPALDQFLQSDPIGQQYLSNWDRTITISKTRSDGTFIIAGGVEAANAQHAAQVAIATIGSSSSIHYLSLDADRAFPKLVIPLHELGAAFERDWEQSNKQSSFRLTKSLFEEWFRYLLATENRESNRHIQSIRRARENGTSPPEFNDHFEVYENAVRAVLPHLRFVGVESQKREILFESLGIPLTFDQLSGGEREVAFLMGQIVRFGLSRGLLLIDEPELHLNSDLLRLWIAFLRGTVQQGQIWLATHSLEVVEVAGQDSTFLLERDQTKMKVISAKSLSSQPIVAALSRTVGSPAFSISNLAFVFIEGTEEIGERERFRLLCELPSHVRFMEGGSCKEVIRRVDELRALGQASAQHIRVGGVLDADWRTDEEKQSFVAQGMHVLGVHEVENLFLAPATLRQLCSDLGRNPDTLPVMMMEEFDTRAGVWIFDAARTSKVFREYPKPSKEVRDFIHRLAWSDFVGNEARCDEMARLHGGLTDDETASLARHLKARTKIYTRKSREVDFWRFCQGKQVFKAVAPRLGFSTDDVGERAVMAVWGRRADLVPEELGALRAYVARL